MSFQQDIDHLVQALEQGQTILYPTETVWGLGCDPHNLQAVQRVFEIKQRPAEKRLVLLVGSLEQLYHYVPRLPQKAARLIEYHERPLTIVYEQVQNLDPQVLAPDGSAAIRLSKDPFCQALCLAWGKALVSTSANISGFDFPTCFDDIPMELKSQVGAIAQHRQKDRSHNPPSTIVKIGPQDELIFLRK